MSKFQIKCSCIKCKQVTTTAQLTRNHKDTCPIDRFIRKPVRFPGNVGRTAWNKGLTKDTDPRVLNNSKKASAAYKKLGLKLTDDQKLNLSRIAKSRGFGGYRENAGRSHKYKVTDSNGKPTTLQSSYEFKCAEILNAMGIKWIRPAHLKYGEKKYFPDFYLIDYDVYLDPKNDYLIKKDEEKIRLASEENNVTIHMVAEDDINIEYISKLLS